MQIELIQQDDDTPSIYTEFLSVRTVQGYHQLAYWSRRFRRNDGVGAGCRLARRVVGRRRRRDAIRLRRAAEQPGDEIIEIMELNDVTAGHGKFVRDAAQNWDGSDPIRVLGG